MLIVCNPRIISAAAVLTLTFDYTECEIFCYSIVFSESLCYNYIVRQQTAIICRTEHNIQADLKVSHNYMIKRRDRPW